MDGTVREVTEPIRTTLPPLQRHRAEPTPTRGSLAIVAIAMGCAISRSRVISLLPRPRSGSMRPTTSSVVQTRRYAWQACDAGDIRTMPSSESRGAETETHSVS
ncbi:hypothetical protein MANES_03G075850v8 [Manihot esculenta]|uniref:Uncharacterized protein n=1 Tax=Manihot esculenta TaxID=3983 RepID=A0ACB7I0H0_MANES|nr:hypothetical protein MANES_03G075850v8 [Manihot esculenta]